MRTVSFQGTQLTRGQTLRIQQQQHIKSFIHPVLADQVNATLAAVESRNQQGIKPERVWFKEREEFGTICIAEWMGF